MPIGFMMSMMMERRSNLSRALRFLLHNLGIRSPSPSELAKAYDAPFPDPGYKMGPRAMPSQVPTLPTDPSLEAQRKAWEFFHAFDKPFLCVFADNDPVTQGLDAQFRESVPGARGLPHATIEGGGHFIQENCPGTGDGRHRRPDSQHLIDQPSMVAGAPGRRDDEAVCGGLYCAFRQHGDAKVRAALMERGRIRVDDVPDPTPAEGEVVVKSVACGICGSDLHAARHTEEFVATSIEAGGAFKLTTFDPGGPRPRILRRGHGASWRVACRRFSFAPSPCSLGIPTVAVGYSTEAPGGFGEYMLLSERLLMPVPAGTSQERAALTEPMAVGLPRRQHGPPRRRTRRSS